MSLVSRITYHVSGTYFFTYIALGSVSRNQYKNAVAKSGFNVRRINIEPTYYITKISNG